MSMFCSVKDCPTNNEPTATRKSHKFPSDAKITKKWLKKLDLQQENHSQVPSSLMVCSLHFKEKDFVRVGNDHELKSSAIPMEFKVKPQKKFAGNRFKISTLGERQETSQHDRKFKFGAERNQTKKAAAEFESNELQ